MWTTSTFLLKSFQEIAEVFHIITRYVLRYINLLPYVDAATSCGFVSVSGFVRLTKLHLIAFFQQAAVVVSNWKYIRGLSLANGLLKMAQADLCREGAS